MNHYYNGRIISDQDVAKPISDAVFYGLGLFDTLRFRNGKILFEDLHLDRLKQQCAKLGFYYPGYSKINQAIQQIIESNEINEGLLKVVLVPASKDDWTDSELYIFPRVLENIKDFPVQIVFFPEREFPILRFTPQFKSLFYLGNILAKQKAGSLGAYEPIFYNEDNIITEGAIRNIFFIKKGTVYTPSESLGILNGIIRQKVIEISQSIGFPIIEGEISFSDLHTMDESFLTSTGIGVIPCKWDKWKSDFNITMKLKNALDDEIKKY